MKMEPRQLSTQERIDRLKHQLENTLDAFRRMREREVRQPTKITRAHSESEQAIPSLERELRDHMFAILDLRLATVLGVAPNYMAEESAKLSHEIVTETRARLDASEARLIEVTPMVREIIQKADLMIRKLVTGESLEEQKDFPKWRFHWQWDPIVVNTRDEELALGRGWGDSRHDFDEFRNRAYRAARQEDWPPFEADPIRWVDDWHVTGLTPALANEIKARILSAHSSYRRRPVGDCRKAALRAMSAAFTGVSEALFDSGILTKHLLDADVPVLIWDSAVAGGWWPWASDDDRNIFRRKIGQSAVHA